MLNLQMHQLRVASVAYIICENLKVDFDTDSVIKACLIHDMGNIVKFNLSYFPEWNEPEGLEYWENIKNDFILKYGSNDHHANLAISKELNLSDKICLLVDSFDPGLVEMIAMDNDLARKICIYADNRVTPHEIVSIDERNLEAKKRYENHPHGFDDERRKFFMENMRKIENQIFSICKIKPKDINNESIKKYFDKLSDFSM